MKTLVALLFILTASHQSSAFSLNSSNNSNFRGWHDANIKLFVNSSNCPAGIDVPAIIADAVKVWNDVPTSSVKVSYGGSTTSSASSSPTTVYCESNFQAVTGADQNGVPGAAAISPSGDYVGGAVLILNASSGTANIQNFDQTKLKIILAHEIGHILGLGHSASPNALMYYNATDRVNLAISQDDIDGISYLYPSDELSSGKIAGCGRISGPGPSGPAGYLMILFALMAPVLLVAGQRLRRTVG